MATDARIATGLPTHPKTKKLIRRHGDGAAWRLICLFLWVASNRSDGDLTGMTNEDIELAADWQGDEGEFVAALVEVGFLDGEDGAYVIHDWAEHNPWAFGSEARSQKAKWNALVKHHGKEKAAELMPEYNKQHATSINPASDQHDDSMHAAETSSAPSLTPSLTPSQDQNLFGESSDSPPKQKRKTRLPPDFDLTAERVTLATEYWKSKNRPDLDPAGEFQKFINHFTANGKPMACWDACWRNWYTNAITFNRPMVNGNAKTEFGSNGNQQRDNSAAGRIAANIARDRAEREAAATRSHREPLVANGPNVWPQVDEQLRGSGRPGERLGSVLEGDFSRAD
jgi:hypothetical protein